MEKNGLSATLILWFKSKSKPKQKKIGAHMGLKILPKGELKFPPKLGGKSHVQVTILVVTFLATFRILLG